MTVTIPMLKALTVAIHDLKEVPSGHLYAHVMGYLDIHQYETAINAILSTKLVEKKGDLLIWKGEA